jgi:hypothetical protein
VSSAHHATSSTGTASLNLERDALRSPLDRDGRENYGVAIRLSGHPRGRSPHGEIRSRESEGHVCTKDAAGAREHRDWPSAVNVPGVCPNPE